MLELKNIIKTFTIGGAREETIVALDDVSIKVNDGDFVTIIGTNGSGKSTTMNIITGVLKPDNGNVLLNGEDITKLSEFKRAKYFGRVFQDPMMGTVADMSIIENLEIAFRRGKKHSPFLWGFKKENKKIFEEALATFDLKLETHLEAKVGNLSGGQRQALTLVMATLNKPDVLLLDEHTAALDPKTAKKVLELTDRIIKKDNLTTLMITHNMRDALTYGNRLIMFYNGKIVLDVKGEEKSKLTVEDLLNLFSKLDASL